MQFYIMTRTHVKQLTLVHVAKCQSTISWIMLFSHDWFQGNSKCINRRQSTQLCPYQMADKQRKRKEETIPKHYTGSTKTYLARQHQGYQSVDQMVKLKSQEQEAQWWKKYFQDILNCPKTTEVHKFSDDCMYALDTCTGNITIEEVKKAMKKLKNGKASGFNWRTGRITQVRRESISPKYYDAMQSHMGHTRDTWRLVCWNNHPYTKERWSERLQQLERDHTAVCTRESYVQHYSGQNQGHSGQDTTTTTAGFHAGQSCANSREDEGNELHTTC